MEEGFYKPRRARDCQELGEIRKDRPLEPSEGTSPCRYLSVSDFSSLFLPLKHARDNTKANVIITGPDNH